MHRNTYPIPFGLRLLLAAGACASESETPEDSDASVGEGETIGTSSGSASSEDSEASTTMSVEASSSTTEVEESSSSDGGVDSTSATTGGTTASDVTTDTLDGTTIGTMGDTTGDTTGTASGMATGSDSLGDTSTGDTAGDMCTIPENKISCDSASATWYQALGLGCVGDDDEVIPLTVHDGLSASDPGNAEAVDTWRIATGFGTPVNPFWKPREGARMLVLGTGVLREPHSTTGVLTEFDNAIDDANGNPDGVNAATLAADLDIHMIDKGGTPFDMCVADQDCSNTLQSQWEKGAGMDAEEANDLIGFSFSVSSPPANADPATDAEGFEIDFAWFSAEYPLFVDSQYNDIFVIWQESENYVGNMTFIDDQPLTVTALEPSITASGYVSTDPEMDGTGFTGSAGGATGWFTARSINEMTPGDTVKLSVALFDMGDSDVDTIVLLDNFRWVCVACVPNEVDPCEVEGGPS